MSKLINGYPSYLVRVDTKRMKILLNEQCREVNAKYIICENCRGKGTTVNPSIDGNGLSQEDFDEDPDFREDYMQGKYDVHCACCDGSGKILVPEEKQDQDILNSIMQDYYNSEKESRAERMMGA